MTEDEVQQDGLRGPRDLGTLSLRLAAWVVPKVAKYTHGSLIAIYAPDNSVLLVQHRIREPRHVGFPGGTHTPHEDPRDAVVREVQEEIGLQLSSSLIEHVKSYDQPWSRHYDHLFRVSLSNKDSAQAHSVEIVRGGWYNLEILPPAKLTMATKYALQFLSETGK